MILIILLAVGILFFSLCYFQESGLFRLKRMVKFDAEIIDEVEDEVYDNTGGAKIRFFKAYEFCENGEKKVVRSERPMRKITDTKGKKCILYVDSKNRKALEKADVIRYRVYGLILLIAALGFMGLYFYLKEFVPNVAM